MKTALNRLLSYEQPQKYIVETENYSETFSTPVLTAGKSFILGYTNETTGVYNGKESPVIIFDDFTGDKKYVDFDFKVKSSAMKLLHKVNTSDNLKYLFYALQSIKYTPFSHKRIWISEYSNFLIEYRHPQEQNAIVLALDGINQAIYNKKQELFSLDELVKSRFIEMFGDIDLSPQKSEWTKLSDLGTIYTGTTPSTGDETNWDGSILWITPAEMNDESFFIDNTIRKITEKGMKSKSLSLMPVGTVLLSTRAPIGKVGIVAKPMTCNQGFKNFYCPNKLNSIFLYVILKNNTQYLNAIGTGTTFKEISKTTCGNIRVPVPPIELQNEFAEFVKLIDKSKFVCHSKNFLCDIFTFSSSTIAYPSVVSIFVCPKRC